MNKIYVIIVIIALFSAGFLYSMEQTEKEQSFVSKPLLAILHNCVCKQMFENKKSLSEHIIKEHFIKAPEGSYYECPAEECITYLQALPDFMRHIQTHSKSPVSVQQPQVSGKRKMDDFLESAQNVNRSISLVQGLVDVSQQVQIAPMSAVSEKLVASLPLYDVNDFDCICGEKFNRQKQLKQHIISAHKDPQGYICPRCNLRLEYPSRYLKHMKAHKKRKVVHPEATTHMDSQETKDMQLTLSSPESQGASKVRENVVPSITIVDRERGETDSPFYDVNNFDCLCGEKFNRQEQLTQHVISAHKDSKGYICPHCNLRLKYPSLCLRHMEAHTNSRIYTCRWPGCNKEFYRAAVLQTHFIESHFYCLHCGRTFASGMDIRMHECFYQSRKRKEVHPDPTTGLESQGAKDVQLTLSFPESQDASKVRENVMPSITVVDRERGKTNDDDIQSEQEKGTSLIQTLIESGNSLTVSGGNNGAHIQEQAGLQSLPLDLACPCGQRFASEEGLKEHLVYSHYQESKYVCPQCSKGMRELFAFTEHIYSHDKSRKLYACTWNGCLCVFTSLYKRQRHIAKHGNNGKRSKNFSCKECTKRFNTRRNLEKHFITIHKQCLTCNKTFTTVEESQSHKHHNKPSQVASGKQEGDKILLSDQNQNNQDFSSTKEMQLVPSSEQGALVINRFECVCGEKFEDDENLRSHVINSHKQEQKYVCPSCNKLFPSPSKLMVHLDTHKNNVSDVKKRKRGQTSPFDTVAQETTKSTPPSANISFVDWLNDPMQNVDDCVPTFQRYDTFDDVPNADRKDPVSSPAKTEQYDETEKAEHDVVKERVVGKRKADALSSDAESGGAEVQVTQTLLDAGELVHLQNNAYLSSKDIASTFDVLNALSTNTQIVVPEISTMQTSMNETQFLMQQNHDSSLEEKSDLPSLKSIYNRKSFDCACKERFTSKELLRQHIIEVHKTDEKRYKCPGCATVMDNPSWLMMHFEARHNNDNKTYSCNWPHCNRKFYEERSLNLHLKQHKEGKKLLNIPERKKSKCPLCSKLFYRGLVVHAFKMHNHCVTCNTTFPTRQEVEVHDHYKKYLQRQEMNKKYFQEHRIKKTKLENEGIQELSHEDNEVTDKDASHEKESFAMNEDSALDMDAYTVVDSVTNELSVGDFLVHDKQEDFLSWLNDELRSESLNEVPQALQEDDDSRFLFDETESDGFDILQFLEDKK